MSTRIEVDDLGLVYGSTRALDGLSFTIDGPGIYGLLGRNGSGKTSLLSVLAGFRKATEGRVRLDGEPVFENERNTQRICLIRETGDTVDHDWPEDKVRHALDFAARTRPYWDESYAARLVDLFRLPLRTSVTALSRGQRAGLAVILGLASRAPVTLFDEAYLGLDAPSRYAFYDELLADFMSHPRTVVVSTHLIEEVSRLFEQVLIIDHGRLLLHEDVEAMRARGASITGPAEEVDRLVTGLPVLSEQRLGRTKSVTVFGELGEQHREAARQRDLELGPVSLQDLFVHLTTGGAEQPGPLPGLGQQPRHGGDA
ncbi:ABC transporter ATP-binding protein [Haloechinothrix sp. LS1_15]|uniref:ABC transporter ATP-binding protein n=1 Tax=Haloechinothrix sp. LS1_15 TaxID=2652248 RepID=UPI0029466C5A|nr:ABC transporter ATP-binding protein [Haloechinothrix sp. LS1_15]MDV6011603.1 ABC transporter ATP-binding protein [Haloechinothrix sp. LS1_15]